MIRIQDILYKITFGIILVLFSVPVHGQIIMGAKGLGMGQATMGVHDYQWAIFANPAMMSKRQTTVGFYGLRNYGFTELTDMAAAATVPTKFGVAGFGFHRYGDDLYNEMRVRVAYKNEWQLLHFAITGNYNHISFGGNYGSGGALGVDVGIAAELTEDLWIGARSTNVNKPKYPDINEELPRDIIIGFTYSFNEIALFAFDVAKDVRFPVSYRGGIEVHIFEGLLGRVGVTTEPLSYSGGFGYGQEMWGINFAVQKHELLGFSPGLDITLKF
ncbi:hypothetical protein ACKGJO_08145 [Gracilimonas sp. Q87]|uniref:hypothetical protein n=1 Tax=Gracilimonas sp. Q87 TaxID=3384766 RepID=UPI003984213B